MADVVDFRSRQALPGSLAGSAPLRVRLKNILDYAQQCAARADTPGAAMDFAALATLARNAITELDGDTPAGPKGAA